MASDNFIKIAHTTIFFPDKNYRSKYFLKITERLENRMKDLYQKIEDISNVISNQEINRQLPSGKILIETLKEQQEILLKLSADVEAYHETINKMREEYKRKQLKFSKEGSASSTSAALIDPFINNVSRVDEDQLYSTKNIIIK